MTMNIPVMSNTFIQDPNNPSYPNPNPTPNPSKRKRNLPGAPDPDSEVMALSPKSLMATNRFVCEICNKGFQRDQNLQLHRRGHNLPWKLKRSDKDSMVKKKVYVCPVNSCVHHHPSRALGDLTGIKKHYSRKHGEKKWKCDKCSKRYAVQSDWKAHSKICGTREYKCDCGTIFSRKDSFNTHRAFCDALSHQAIRSYATATASATAPMSNLNYRPETMNLRPPAYGSLIVSNNGLIRSSKQVWLDHNHHGIGNPHEKVMIDNASNWSSLVSHAMFPANIVLKEEDDGRGFSSNTLPASENSYYGNEQGITTTSFMSSATALLQKAVHMGSTSPSNISSIFCNSSINGGTSSSSSLLIPNIADEQQQQQQNLNNYTSGGTDDRFLFNDNSNPFSMIHEASTTRDFLGGGGGGGWSTFDMARIASLGPAAAAAAMSGHCSTGPGL